jgi:hypothetical protein
LSAGGSSFAGRIASEGVHSMNILSEARRRAVSIVTSPPSAAAVVVALSNIFMITDRGGRLRLRRL